LACGDRKRRQARTAGFSCLSAIEDLAGGAGKVREGFNALEARQGLMKRINELQFRRIGIAWP
jgi:hypothetical protein